MIGLVNVAIVYCVRCTEFSNIVLWEVYRLLGPEHLFLLTPIFHCLSENSHSGPFEEYRVWQLCLVRGVQNVAIVP